VSETEPSNVTARTGQRTSVRCCWSSVAVDAKNDVFSWSSSSANSRRRTCLNTSAINSTYTRKHAISVSVRLSVCLSVSISPELHTSDPHQLCTRYLGPWLGRQAVLGTLLVLEGRVLDTSLWLGRPLAACISGSTIQMTSCLHVTGPMDARRRSKRRHCVVVRRLTPLPRHTGCGLRD